VGAKRKGNFGSLKSADRERVTLTDTSARTTLPHHYKNEPLKEWGGERSNGTNTKKNTGAWALEFQHVYEKNYRIERV